MTIELSVPSKTFLVGEYAVLRGAPALVAAVQPQFRFRAEKTEAEQKSLFHPESAAGRWFRQSEVLLRDWKVSIVDPHEGRGGFGASGAEFVFYHSLCTYIQSKALTDNPADLWQDFRACDSNGASGADVAAQAVGGITYFRWQPEFEARAYGWPFDEADFCIIRTGEKVATHSHLATLGQHDFTDVTSATDRAIEGFFSSNVEAFAAGISDFQRALEKLGLQTATTTDRLKQIAGLHGVLAAKGCGAMGGDTILVVIDREFKTEFYSDIRRLGMEITASTPDLAPAPQLKVID